MAEGGEKERGEGAVKGKREERWKGDGKIELREKRERKKK